MRNPRSGWQHRAWGEAQRNPRIAKPKISKAREAADRRCDEDRTSDSTVGRFADSNFFNGLFLGFRFAPPPEALVEIYEVRGAADGIKPGVERSETPGNCQRKNYS
jgi:hypothetical protein